jgi:hypothetical protein
VRPYRKICMLSFFLVLRSCLSSHVAVLGSLLLSESVPSFVESSLFFGFCFVLFGYGSLGYWVYRCVLMSRSNLPVVFCH